MIKLSIVSLLVGAACGSSAKDAVPAAAPATPSGTEVRAVPLVAAAGDRPTRAAACMELGVFEEGHDDACTPGIFEGSRAADVRAPWTSSDVVRLNAGGEQDSTACALIITVDDAAWIARDWLAFCDDDDKALATARWTLSDLVPGGAPELTLELTRDEQEIIDSVRTPTTSTTYRAWCGLGPSGTPSCTAPLPVSEAATSRPVFP